MQKNQMSVRWLVFVLACCGFAIAILVWLAVNDVSEPNQPQQELEALRYFDIPRELVWCGDELYYVAQAHRVHDDGGMTMKGASEENSHIYRHGDEEAIHSAPITSNIECWEKSLLYVAGVGGQTHLYQLDLNTGAETDIKPVPYTKHLDISATGQIAFNGDGKMLTTDLSSASPHSFSPPAPNIQGEPVWSPDGSQVAFNLYKPGVTAPTWGVTILDVNTGDMTEISEGSDMPVWSSNGTLAYDTGDGVAIYNTSTGEKVLAEGIIGDELTWSPDGSQLAFTRAVTEPSSDGGNRIVGGELCIAQTDGSITCRDFEGQEPLWSPDGTQLAYLVYEEDSARVEVIDFP